MARPTNLALALLFALTTACAAAQAQRTGPSIPISRTVHGQVRYAQGGAPAENVIVRLESFIGGLAGEERTDRLGKFRFSGLQPAQYVLTVRHRGFRELRQQFDLETNPSEYLQLQLVPDEGAASAPAPLAPALIDASVPAEARAEYEKGRAALLGGGGRAKGLAHLERAVQLHPKFFEAHLLLGTAYGDDGKWDKSEAELSRAVELNPRSSHAAFALGEAYRRRKKYEEAEKVLKRGLALDDKSAQGHFTLGRVYFEQGDIVRAGPEVGRALQLKPDFAEAHLVAGNILLRARQPENALVEYQEYLRLAPSGEFAAEAREMVRKLKQALAEKK
jgi:Tfp pilus assembly protein PilF